MGNTKSKPQIVPAHINTIIVNFKKINDNISASEWLEQFKSAEVLRLQLKFAISIYKSSYYRICKKNVKFYINYYNNLTGQFFIEKIKIDYTNL
jgi:hypothetical protein